MGFCQSTQPQKRHLLYCTVGTQALGSSDHLLGGSGLFFCRCTQIPPELMVDEKKSVLRAQWGLSVFTGSLVFIAQC